MNAKSAGIHRQISCETKHRFPNKKDADKAANSIMKRKSITLTNYFCSICQGYHLTKKL